MYHVLINKKKKNRYLPYSPSERTTIPIMTHKLKAERERESWLKISVERERTNDKSEYTINAISFHLNVPYNIYMVIGKSYTLNVYRCTYVKLVSCLKPYIRSRWFIYSIVKFYRRKKYAKCIQKRYIRCIFVLIDSPWPQELERENARGKKTWWRSRIEWRESTNILMRISFHFATKL